jgi:hypothetical protein
MADRLPIDSHVVAYWGFDEANETDQALDEGSYGRPLTVTSAVAAVPARVGNGRQFDGAATIASPVDSTPFQLLSSLTLITWVQVTQFNSTGSLQRTILSCEGTGGTNTSNTLYRLSVDSNGSIVYMHMLGNQATMTWKSANGVFKAGRFQSVVLVRTDVGGGNCTCALYVDGFLVSWASAVYSANPGTDYRSIPAPLPTTGTPMTQVLRLGQSGLSSDNSKWLGIIDEVSIHDTARLANPYLRAAYYRISLAANSNRLTLNGTVKNVGSAELSTGCRWWTYERDLDLFVIREQPLGYFSPEIQLTTGGTAPGAAGKPKLVYDAGTDTLLIIFVTNSKIYKITATATDVPTTQNVHTVFDQGNQLKADPVLEGARVGTGGPSGNPWFENRRRQYLDNPGFFTIEFYPNPFGILIPATAGAYGFEIWRYSGGQDLLLGTVTAPLTAFTVGQGGTFYFYPVPNRVFGSIYFARALDKSGKPFLQALSSNYVIDYLGQGVVYWGFNAATPVINHDKEMADISYTGSGGPPAPDFQRVYLVNRTPVKLGFVEAAPGLIGAGGPPAPDFSRVSFINRTPIKLGFTESSVPQLGAGGGELFRYPTRAGVPIAW